MVILIAQLLLSGGSIQGKAFCASGKNRFGVLKMHVFINRRKQLPVHFLRTFGIWRLELPGVLHYIHAHTYNPIPRHVYVCVHICIQAPISPFIRTVGLS